MASGSSWLGACGVSDATHHATLRDLERLKAEAAAADRRCEDSQTSSTKHIRVCDNARLSAEARAQVFEAKHLALKRQRGELTGEVNALEVRVVELKEARRLAEGRRRAMVDLLGRFRSLAESSGLTAELVGGRLTIRLSSAVLFDSGSANLRVEAAKVLTGVAEVLRSVPDREFQIEGHTDNKRLLTDAYKDNWQLSAARALTVLRFLVQRGVPGKTMSAAGFGEHRPVDTNETQAGRSNNRRIQIVLVPDLSQLPGFDEQSPVVPPGDSTQPVSP